MSLERYFEVIGVDYGGTDELGLSRTVTVAGQVYQRILWSEIDNDEATYEMRLYRKTGGNVTIIYIDVPKANPASGFALLESFKEVS